MDMCSVQALSTNKVGSVWKMKKHCVIVKNELKGLFLKFGYMLWHLSARLSFAVALHQKREAM